METAELNNFENDFKCFWSSYLRTNKNTLINNYKNLSLSSKIALKRNNNLTKKERNYYLKEMLNQISIIKDYEELLNDFKNDI